MKKLLFIILLLPVLAQAQWKNMGTGTWQITTDNKLLSTTFSGFPRKIWYQKSQVDSIFLAKTLIFNNGLTLTGNTVTLEGTLLHQTVQQIPANVNMQYLRQDILNNYTLQNALVSRNNVTSYNNTTDVTKLIPVAYNAITRFSFKLTKPDTLGITIGNTNAGASGALKGQWSSLITSSTAFHDVYFNSVPLDKMSSFPAVNGDVKIFYADQTVHSGTDTLNGNDIKTIYHMRDAPTSGFHSTYGIPNRADGLNHSFYTLTWYKQNSLLSTARVDTLRGYTEDLGDMSAVSDNAYFMDNKYSGERVRLASNDIKVPNIPTGTPLNNVYTDSNGKMLKGTALFNVKGVGSQTLSSGTKSFSVTGATSSSLVIGVTVSAIGGTVTTTWKYVGTCSTGTCTITAKTTSNTTNSSDTSTVDYVVVN